MLAINLRHVVHPRLDQSARDHQRAAHHGKMPATQVPIPEQVRSQIANLREDGGLRISLRLIKEKIANSIDTLRHAFPRSAAIDVAMNKLAAELALLKRAPPATVSHLMGVEGRVGYAYFNAWRACPLKWKGTDRRPIPDDWHQIGRRSSKLGTQSHPNRNATHPVNAMLNYAYGILESQVRMQVMAAGLDPTMGILHGNARGKHGLVYDLMEPLRPIVDRTVLKFVQAHTFHPTDFSITSDGASRLNPEMAKCVARMVAADLESLIAGHAAHPPAKMQFLVQADRQESLKRSAPSSLSSRFDEAIAPARSWE